MEKLCANRNSNFSNMEMNSPCLTLAGTREKSEKALFEILASSPLKIRLGAVTLEERLEGLSPEELLLSLTPAYGERLRLLLLDPLSPKKDYTSES